MSRPDLCNAVFLSPRALREFQNRAHQCRGRQRPPRGGFLGIPGGVPGAGSLPCGGRAEMESGAAGSRAYAHACACPSKPTFGFKTGFSLQVPFPAELRPIPSHRLQVRCARLRGCFEDVPGAQRSSIWSGAGARGSVASGRSHRPQG